MAGRLNVLDMWWLIPPAESVGSSKSSKNTNKNKSKSPSVRSNSNSANSKNTKKVRSSK